MGGHSALSTRWRTRLQLAHRITCEQGSMRIIPNAVAEVADAASGEWFARTFGWSSRVDGVMCIGQNGESDVQALSVYSHLACGEDAHYVFSSDTGELRADGTRSVSCSLTSVCLVPRFVPVRHTPSRLPTGGTKCSPSVLLDGLTYCTDVDQHVAQVLAAEAAAEVLLPEVRDIATEGRLPVSYKLAVWGALQTHLGCRGCWNGPL